MDTQPFPEGPPGGADGPHLRVLAQYIKRLSFANPMAAASARAYETQPTIDMGVEVKSRRIDDNGEAWEVDLILSVTAKREAETMFSADLIYSGLFQFVNCTPEEAEPLIWIECPRLLFPFSRQILADVTRDGGYPPLLINPIDFTPLYYQELRDREAKQGENADVPLAAPPTETANPSSSELPTF